jgi:hypothetical protein
LTDGRAAGCFLSDGAAGRTAPEGRADVPDCLVTVPEGFELLGLVTVTFLLLEVVLEVPVVERDSPLRACASAPDSNATKASAVNIVANAVLIVLIIVPF